MAIERKAWACEHCNRRPQSSKKRVEEHEKICLANSDVRACKTCDHNLALYARNEDGILATAGFTCAKQLLPVGEKFVRGCSSWEAISRGRRSLTLEPPASDERAAAFAEARALIDELGQDHPKAMLAMIKAVELADPGHMDKALADCGITLPEPTHMDENGTPLINSHDLAAALGVSHEEVVENIESLSAQGGITIPTKFSRIQ